jgi:RNA ligase (TIGR02306 family)
MEGKGWNIITGRGDFKKGDLVVYFEIDSCLPIEERYSFLADRCLKTYRDGGSILKQVYRIRSMKLRGIYSQGLIMPLSHFPEIVNPKEGDDVTDLLKVELYGDLEQQYNPTYHVGGEIAGDFPDWLEKTDEERIQNLEEWFENDKLRDVEFEVTEKYDGASGTFVYAPQYSQDPFFVCSRNKRLRKTDDNVFWEINNKYHIEDILKELYETEKTIYAIQGEVVGIGINGNRDKYNGLDFFVFRIRNVTENRWITPEERYELCKRYGLKHVKVIKESMKVFDELRSVDEVLEFVEGKTDRGNEREGMVFKSLPDSLLSFKAVSNKYLLKIGE